MPRRWCLFFAVPLLVWAGSAWGIDSYAAEPTPAQAFEAVPATLSQFLDPHGIRLVSYTRGKKTEICDLWWRKQVATQPRPGAPQDLMYSGLTTGQFLGVVSYLVPREDFQHHMLKPGLYSMRYAALDQDPSDETVSPYRDFVILSPIWAEKDSDAIVPLEELQKRGRMISHKHEPAVLSLMPVNPDYKRFPWAVSDDRGFCTVQVLLHQQAGKKQEELPLAIVLIRPPYENEGS